MASEAAGVDVAVKNLSKSFSQGGGQQKAALDNVTFNLGRGEFAVVIGSNGAGKSTLLNTIAGDTLPDSGRISIGGEEVQRLPAHRRAKFVARVFQDPMLGTAAELSIEENLAVAMKRGKRRRLNRGVKNADRELFRHLLSGLGLGLEGRLGDSVQLLSGGQRQALTLIMATIANPGLLLLDEHAAALDPRAAALIMRSTIETVEQSAVTTLMVTHNMEHAVAYGNRLLMMDAGRIILNASCKEKAGLTPSGLVDRFHSLVTDRMRLV